MYTKLQNIDVWITTEYTLSYNLAFGALSTRKLLRSCYIREVKVRPKVRPVSSQMVGGILLTHEENAFEVATKWMYIPNKNHLKLHCRSRSLEGL